MIARGVESVVCGDRDDAAGDGAGARSQFAERSRAGSSQPVTRVLLLRLGREFPAVVEVAASLLGLLEHVVENLGVGPELVEVV